MDVSSGRDLPTGGMSEQLEVVELPMVRMKLVSHRRFYFTILRAAVTSHIGERLPFSDDYFFL